MKHSSDSSPVNVGSSQALPVVLFVSHEATRTGAPMFLLHFLRWLRRSTQLRFEVLLAKGGALTEAFAEVAPLRTPADFVKGSAKFSDYTLIYSNTACNGEMFRRIPPGDTPVVTHVHELDMGYHWLGAKNMAEVMRHTAHFIACAQAVASRLESVFSVPADRISVHYEMIDGGLVTKKPSGDEGALRRSYGIPEDAHVISACGTFDFRKAPDLFLQVASKIKGKSNTGRPYRFLWIGSHNSPDLVRLIREDARKLGMQDEVLLVGELASPHGLIALSDVFCLTSREDPFPLIMLESALLKRPVLCFTGAGGASEFCARGGGIAVPYLDTDSMACAASDLVADPSRASALGEQASALVKAHFVVEAVAPALWESVQRLLNGSGLTRRFAANHDDDGEIFATWDLSSSPQRPWVETSLRRWRAKREALALVARGKRKEAVGHLLECLKADLGHGDPSIILEGLIVIGDSLVRLDPARSRELLKQTERLIGLNPSLATADQKQHLAQWTRLLTAPAGVAA